MIKLEDVRTAHVEGYTFAGFLKDNLTIVTGGADGDVRIYPAIFDDETISVSVGEKVTSGHVKDNLLVLGNNQHEVTSYALPAVTLEHVLIRFTATVNHVCLSGNGKLVAASSSDFTIKVVSVDGTDQKTFTGHKGPVLSTCFGERNETLVSCSCDGSVRLWNIKDQKCEKVLNTLPKMSSTDQICIMSSVCTSEKQHVAVPSQKSIKVYLLKDLTHVVTLETEHSQEISVVQWSSNGRYLCSGSKNGEIFIWDMTTKSCFKKYQHHLSSGLTSILWNDQDGGTILFADTDGAFGICKIFSSDNIEGFDNDDLGDLLLNSDKVDDDADDGDGIFVSASAKKNKKRGLQIDDGDNGENDIMMSAKKKHRINNFDSFLDDEAEDDENDDNNISLNLIKEGLVPSLTSKPMIDDENDSLSSFIVDKPKPKPVENMVFMQKPFQPSSTPLHLMHRYMVWNSIGIIRCHAEDDVSSIDVEFHNSRTSHPLHIANVMSYTMAALSESVVIFACEKQDKMPSKLFCNHFASWDSNKEWSLQMPDDESIQAISANKSFVCVATTKRTLRILSVGGWQAELHHLPGPAVSMAMHEKQLVVLYQKSSLKNCQCLGVLHMKLIKDYWKVIEDRTLTFGESVSVSWIGFSTEGTPALVTSTGDVLLIQRRQRSWIKIGDTKKQAKNKSDNYWVIGIDEAGAQIRCIYCKGANFPATLPRPVPMFIPFQIPLCESQTENSIKEHELMKTRLISSNLDFNVKSHLVGVDVNLDAFETQQSQLLIQLFALACKSDRDFRAVEVCQLMSIDTINLAIQYATKMRRLGIAKKLTELAREKASQLEDSEYGEEDEEDEGEDERHESENEEDILMDEDDFDEVGETMKEEERAKEIIEKTKSVNVRLKSRSRSIVLGGDKDDDSGQTPKENFGSGHKFPRRSTGDSSVNPFKVSSQNNDKSVRGTDYFETLQSQQLTNEKREHNKDEKKPTKKKTVKISATNQKSISFTKKAERKENEILPDTKLSGFQLFLKKQCSEADDESDVTAIMQKWKKLKSEEKTYWNNKAKGTQNEEKAKTHDKEERRKILTTNDKLASFAFKKD